MDPLLAAYGRGMIPDFPARPDIVIDVIPVDLVVNACIAAATQAIAASRHPLLMVGAGAHAVGCRICQTGRQVDRSVLISELALRPALTLVWHAQSRRRWAW